MINEISTPPPSNKCPPLALTKINQAPWGLIQAFTVIRTFKKLSYKKTQLVQLIPTTNNKSRLKNIFRSEFQVKRIEEIKEKVLFLDGNSDHLCLVRVPNVRGVCG